MGEGLNLSKRRFDS